MLLSQQMSLQIKISLNGVELNQRLLTRRHWRWIGHVICQEASSAKTALNWTPEGKSQRGRPKIIA